MAQYPAMPFWTDAYLGDTHDLTTIEHGAYLLLLFAMWRAGGALPNDDRKLAKVARLNSQQWARLRDTIMEFMTVSADGLTITQGRLADELEYVRKHSKKQSKNARARWEKVTDPQGSVQQTPPDSFNGAAANPLGNNEEADAMGMPNACQTDAPTPTPTIVGTKVPTLSDSSASDGTNKAKKAKASNAYTPEYEALWSAYPSTIGMSKLNGFKAWQQLTAEQQAQAVASIPAYRALLAKNPERTVKHLQGYLSGRMFESFPNSNVTDLETPAQWEKRLTFARLNREWSPTKWGPMPGEPGCRVPTDLIRPGDGDGWRAQRAA